MHWSQRGWAVSGVVMRTLIGLDEHFGDRYWAATVITAAVGPVDAQQIIPMGRDAQPWDSGGEE